MNTGTGAATGVAIDVAIVAYRRWDLTRSCLNHLLSQTRAHRLIVCDNGCDERTADRVAAEFPAVRVVALERNMPYPVACNRAVGVGSGELVVMMNNDVDARPDFIERLTDPLIADATLGSVASLLLAPGEASVDSAGLTADPTLAGFPRFQGRPPGQVDARHPVLAGPAGAAAAFRRCAWEQVGGLDERIPAYLEDLDLALRLRQAGWSTHLAIDAVAVHIGSATFGHRSARQRWCAGFSRGYLIRRYGGRGSPVALRTAVTEAIVVAGDLAMSRDAAALRGRISGWRSARGLPRRPAPPAVAIEPRIDFVESLRLRRASYA